jgi:hypothetical protein
LVAVNSEDLFIVKAAGGNWWKCLI